MNNNRRNDMRLILVAACVAAIGLGGCVNITRDNPARQHFALQLDPDSAPIAPAIAGAILKVRVFQEMPRYRGREFVYRVSDVRYETDYYNLFLVSPGPLLAEATACWLAQGGVFERVVDSSSRVRSTHLLEGAVVALEGDYRVKHKPRAVLGLSLTLVDETADLPRIAFQRHYVRSVDIADTRPETLVMGWSKAMQELLVDFDRDLAGIADVLRDEHQKRIEK